MNHFQDKVEANGGRLWVSTTVLRESNGGESTAAEGGDGAKGTETLPTILHEHEPSHHPHYVPPMRACRRLILGDRSHKRGPPGSPPPVGTHQLVGRNNPATSTARYPPPPEDVRVPLRHKGKMVNFVGDVYMIKKCMKLSYFYSFFFFLKNWRNDDVGQKLGSDVVDGGNILTFGWLRKLKLIITQFVY